MITDLVGQTRMSGRAKVKMADGETWVYGSLSQKIIDGYHPKIVEVIHAIDSDGYSMGMSSTLIVQGTYEERELTLGQHAQFLFWYDALEPVGGGRISKGELLNYSDERVADIKEVTDEYNRNQREHDITLRSPYFQEDQCEY